MKKKITVFQCKMFACPQHRKNHLLSYFVIILSLEKFRFHIKPDGFISLFIRISISDHLGGVQLKP